MATILSTSAQTEIHMLEVIFSASKEEGSESKPYLYPFVWLRDNCQCSDCFHEVAKGRLLYFIDLDLQDFPTNVKVADDGLALTITWASGHSSCYDSNWLLLRRFADDNNLDESNIPELPMKLWGSELQGKLKRNKFSNVMASDEALYQWLVELEETGIFLLTGAPPDEDALKLFAGRVAHLKRTSYGETFKVLSSPTPSNVAFTTTPLALHTDLPYYSYSPGVQLLHCMRQSCEGGASVFADGFHVAEQLRKEDPEAFRILSETPINYVDVGTHAYTFNMIQRKPIIGLDKEGNVVQINHSHHARDSYLRLSPDVVHKHYLAMRRFDEMLYDKKNLIKIKMKSGGIICFHNDRVLHGRQGYRVQGQDQRLLVGGYIDWDEMRSKRRVLEEMFSTQ